MPQRERSGYDYKTHALVKRTLSLRSQLLQPRFNHLSRLRQPYHRDFLDPIPLSSTRSLRNTSGKRGIAATIRRQVRISTAGIPPIVTPSATSPGIPDLAATLTRSPIRAWSAHPACPPNSHHLP